MTLNKIIKRMNFLIHHFERSDVTDWIILKHELQQWEKDQDDYFKKTCELKSEIEQLKRELFDCIMVYDPQLIIKELKIDGSEFVRRKKENDWNQKEVEQVLKELVYE